MRKTTLTAALLLAVCGVANAKPQQLPDEYSGWWFCDEERLTGFKVAMNEQQNSIVNTDAHGWCRVINIGAAHPGWHTDEVSMQCPDGVKLHQTWHVQKFFGHTFMSVLEQFPEGPSMKLCRAMEDTDKSH